MEKGARFSIDGTHRFLLWRIWEKSKGLVCYIGLNPSVANADEDDNTITRLIHFTKDHGYGGFYIVNLFSQVATDFKELKSALSESEGRDNWYIWKFATKSNLVCLMYGDKGSFNNRNMKVLTLLSKLSLLGKLFAFKITKRLNPGHPLYLPNTTKFVRVIPMLPDGTIKEYFR
jgi:hypothetical protein